MTEDTKLALPDLDPVSLLDSLSDGVYITDTERKIILWNRAAERITGWQATEVVGRTCFDNILCHIDKDGHCLCGQEHCPLHRAVVTGKPSEVPLLVYAQRKSGERIPVEVTVSPLRNRAGTPIGGIEIFRNASAGFLELLRAKAIQEFAYQREENDDPRFEIEVCHEARDLVGGDFHRLERLDDGSLAILVADVMGHGIPAALYTMHLASLWDHHHDKLDAPADVLGIMNRHMHHVAVEAGFFATAVAARYVPDSGELVLARAGHPSPILFRRNGETEALGPRRPALGLLPETIYESSSIHLAPGEEVLIFTDGAVEVCDEGDNQLGVEGLCRLARELADDDPDGTFHLDPLEEHLLRFSNEIHLPDDLTLLKLRRTA